MKKKAYGIFVILMLMLGVACYSIANISGGAAYVAATGSQSVYKLDVAKTRGIIYDCRMRPLVGARRQWVAAVAPTIEAIGALETVTEGEYRERLKLGLEDGKPFTMLLDKVVDNQCVDLFSVPKRYSENQLAPHIIGYLDSMGSGVTGIELAMNDILDENTGEISIYYQVDALGRVIAGADRLVENNLERAQGGVALTIDSTLQRIAQEAAGKLGTGAVVITEAPGCSIRAVASVPDFSPLAVGDVTDDKDAPLVNRAFSAYSPGSVFKLIAAAVELEEGSSPKSFTCTGSINSDGLIFNCIDGKPHGKLDLQGAIENSCNCYFINAARSLGGQSILSMAYNLGMGVEQEFGRGLITDSGKLPEASSLKNVRALANFAFGQGELSVTPLQLCAMMNAIASDGEYSTPQLIQGQVNSNKELLAYQSISDKTVKAMEITTAKKLQKALISTAQKGTATVGAPGNCVSGIKTGTAQTGVYENGEELLNFWYCGFICQDGQPKYCITVLKDSSPEDKGATAQVFKEIATKIAELNF